jgi:transforming growth factor-beta-induced protein
MKPSFRKLAFIVLPGLAVIASCHKDNNPSPNPASTPLQTYIAGDTSLSIYNAAIAKANDASLYAGSDSVTVLIPTNAAFRAEGISAATISSMSSTAVDSLLRYQYINQSADLNNGTYTTYNSYLGSPIYGYGGTADSNYFNGAQATKVLIPGSEATVYRLNTPLGIPYSSSSNYFASDTSLSYFNAALTRTGLNPSTNTGWTTVLAPTNSAFQAAGYPTIASIQNADSAQLRTTLMYNMLPGQYFTNSYNGITTVPTAVSGANVTIGTSATGATFMGTGNTTATGFAGSNQIVGSNTIYQPVNGLLMQ